MAEIVVASGKGGVGKSTVSSSLSVLLKDKNIGIVDADAEAPNLHIIFDLNKWDEEIEYKNKSLAVIDYGKCDNCLKCEDACVYEAIYHNERVRIKEYLCEGCGACKVVCPRKAIEIKSGLLSGWIRISSTPYGPFVTSELDVGQPNSGKLVTEEKNIARGWIREGRVKNLIVDSAAGIGCQVIASMSGATHAILVAEPTESSLSDLSRAYNLAVHFRVKPYIVINKSNINPGFKGINVFARENGLEIIGEIPYDREVPRSMAYRRPLVIFSPKSISSRALMEISENVKKFLD
ncbi:MAG: P-loop NTPase [Euryarchaeota archaeon]|nr:P-loop NTPase [Euryarchaeota archaeon]